MPVENWSETVVVVRLGDDPQFSEDLDSLEQTLKDNDVDVVLDRATWSPQPVFELVRARGRVEQTEMERTFNMGVGMVAVIAPGDVDRALAVLTARHVPAWVLGEVTPAQDGAGSVAMSGVHPA